VEYHERWIENRCREENPGATASQPVGNVLRLLEMVWKGDARVNGNAANQTGGQKRGRTIVTKEKTGEEEGIRSHDKLDKKRESARGNQTTSTKGTGPWKGRSLGDRTVFIVEVEGGRG